MSCRSQASLAQRPVHAQRAATARLRPRHLRHEGLHRTRAGAGAGNERRALKKPLHFAFSHDEEVGCFGAPSLIRCLPRGLARPRIAIIGEPTSMQVAKGRRAVNPAPGHRTRRPFEPARSGRQRDLRRRRDHDRIGRLHGEGACRARPDSGFDPPHTTMSSARSAAVPRSTSSRAMRIEWEFRHAAARTTPGDLKCALTGLSRTDLLPRMRRSIRRQRSTPNRRRRAAADPGTGSQPKRWRCA